METQTSQVAKGEYVCVCVCVCVEAYQGHMLSMLCAMPTVFIYCLTTYPSAKEQQFMYLIIQLTGHFSRGMAIMMTAEALVYKLLF